MPSRIGCWPRVVEMPDIKVNRFERVQISLDEIFVRIVGRTPDDDAEGASNMQPLHEAES